MAWRREMGIYKFATPPGGQGVLTGWYRTRLEQGDMESVTRSIRWWDGLNYEPYYPCLDTDLSPESVMVCSMLHDPIPGQVEPWMRRSVVAVTGKTLRQFMCVYDCLGEDYVLSHFCPVAWATASNPSEKDLKEKTLLLIRQSGHGDVPFYNIAVSDESLRKYNISMPVIWMRRAFLRTFKTGNELLNIYRMMGDRITEKYEIPPYREEED